MLGEFEDAREEDAPRDAVGGEREQHAQNARERALRRGGLDTFMMFHADAYTTPWHWCLYTFAVEYGRADWAYPVLIYNFYRNTYLLLFFLPGFLVDKVNTDLGTAAAAFGTPPFLVDRVHGKMSAAERRAVLSQIDDWAGPTLITNAQVLTTGVDVPAVDMVVFADPKQSHIDIPVSYTHLRAHET